LSISPAILYNALFLWQISNNKKREILNKNFHVNLGNLSDFGVKSEKSYSKSDRKNALNNKFSSCNRLSFFTHYIASKKGGKGNLENKKFIRFTLPVR